MPSLTTYEWDIETFDPVTDDIIDHDHQAALSCYSRSQVIKALTEEATRIVLVRDKRGHCDVDHDRSWAYLIAGELPEMFDNGSPVPLRFKKEFAALIASIA